MRKVTTCYCWEIHGA